MIVAALAVALLLASIGAKSRKLSAGQKFPKGPPAWPIPGHLPALLTGKPTHQTLADLACGKHGYGFIMGLHLGCRPTIVLSGKEAAKEVLLTHDKIFANRPHFRLADDLFFGFNNAVILSSYTPRLVWLRKVYTQELFTAKRLQQL
ncbi:hypothetical protein GOP47_0017139 [Adiantum capillus-veneris]|uniref:Cytochrome P450 n=1 Tax=Adiantum capillus-veneris TaxID=13818 RepID=A0A9D4UJ15_ADICA|nr:hypothetical protein GOP47_0017139 [Adiantum capillus-veneris]